MSSNIADRFLQNGVNADNYLIGPAVVLVQDPSAWATVLTDGTGFPRNMDDVVDMANGNPISAHGWEYLGYTMNIKQDRNRSTVFHDADQQARVEEVSDTWEEQLTFDLLEVSPAKLAILWQGNAGDPTAVSAGSPAFAQEQVDFGAPTTIVTRRVALLHVDKRAYGHMYVYRKCSMHPTGGPTYSRTGNVAVPVRISVRPDTREANVDARSLRYYHTTVPIT